jgi:hypothetical protein
VTTNQTRALHLARALSDGRLSAATISDDDWTLLLLAAGINHAGSTPAVVSRHVLDSAAAETGYFWPGDALATQSPCPPALALVSNAPAAAA